MVAWSQLLLPALLSAVLVFIVSSLIHMVIKWHKSEYLKFANEDEVRVAVRRGAPTPGQYVLPYAKDPQDCSSPEMVRKFEEGPNGMMYVRANGPMKLGPFLGQWFGYSLIVSVLAAYVARTVLPAGADYLKVFQVVGASAWLAYAWGEPCNSIWRGQPWKSTFVFMFDGLVYAALTAGAFGWLWPAAIVGA
jgi:hypothetical protein